MPATTSRYEAYAATDPGCVRSNNEDTYWFSEEAGLFILADGMGGAKAGEHASSLAVDTLARHVSGANGGPSADLLHKGFEAANEMVRRIAATDDAFRGMGTTLVSALDCGGKLAVASVGDSRCYLFQGGSLQLVTEDQTWVQEVGRHLGLEEAALRTHPMRHVLTMAIGADVHLRVHGYTVDPAPGAEVMLCSDGLHGVVGPLKIEQALNSGQSLEAQCHYLIDEARKAGGPDNITVVLLRRKAA
jgi:PPM family protein phosphatase